MSGIIRFAPSPTGFLHEGHLLSALYVWAAAKKWHLKVHLRIEDHDKSRARPIYIKGIYEDLSWFGFHYDSESIQSKRENIYKTALEKLIKQNLIYPCYCSRKQLEIENPKSKTGEIIYQGKCLHTTNFDSNLLEILQKKENHKKPHNLRFIVPDKVIHWHDERLGDFDENPKNQCGDFPVRDRDNQWTYQLSVCADDIEEGITHIVRGEDIRNSTARQIALMNALGKKNPPIYLHHSLIFDNSGKKLSKRELAYSLKQDRDRGKTPEMLIGEVCFKAHLQGTPSPISLESAISLILATL